MSSKTLQLAIQGLIALVAVGGAVAYALVAQQSGHSPEPPAWLSLLIGIIGGSFFSATAHSNGNAAALQTFAAALYAAQLDPLHPPQPPPAAGPPPARPL